MLSLVQSAKHLRNDWGDNACGFDARKFDVKAVNVVPELFVIYAQQVQDRCMQIMDRDLIDDSVQAEFIGFTMTDAAFNTTPGEPRCESVRIVVASGFGFDLRDRKSSKLTPTDDQRLFQQASLLQICQQRGNWLVHFAGKATMIAFDIDMSVPAFLILRASTIELHETNAGFDHSSGGQTLSAEVSTTLIVKTIHIAR